MAVTIETGVPIPKRGGQGRKPSVLPDSVREMPVGASFLVHTAHDARRHRQALIYLSKQTGKKFTSRKSPEGWRFWRTA